MPCQRLCPDETRARRGLRCTRSLTASGKGGRIPGWSAAPVSALMNAFKPAPGAVCSQSGKDSGYARCTCAVRSGSGSAPAALDGYQLEMKIFLYQAARTACT